MIMVITGFVLWFPAIASQFVPVVWFIKVSEIVHFYEAILATAAIFVWHLFFVAFHPGEYPMSFAWINGKIPLADYEQHHKRDFDELSSKYVKENDKLDLNNLDSTTRNARLELTDREVDPNGFDNNKKR